MSREQLEAFAYRIREELEREREERNFFQLERDKLRTFWEITRQQLEESRAALRNKDRAIEEAEEKHEAEIKIFKQKVKHLMYEHHSALSELKAEQMVTLKLAEESYIEQEMEYLQDKKTLKGDLNETSLAHGEEIKALILKHGEEVHNIRTEFAKQVESLDAKAEDRLTTLRNHLTLSTKMELAELEERKNQQINQLVKNHQEAYEQLKSYYSEITLNNLSLITTLKEQMMEMKNNENKMEKKLYELTSENKRLVQPLKAAKEQVAELQHQLEFYDKDKLSLANTKKQLNAVTKQLQQLTNEHDILQFTNEKIKAERDDLHDKFVSAILDLQQKAGLKNTILEKKLAALEETLEKREVQLSEAISATNLDPKTMRSINSKLEEVLNVKNKHVKDLQMELARVCKAHDDMLRTYEAKLAQFGIRKEELGFEPLRANVGRGPAGLVTST
ncbi:dynein regulatory complex subunit 4-like [Lycorma delicatula]|uniref:dynein regulatory complex subunit 4-like n=1 Tax=Lycorma delicatula TaxID=130591 RepID=UPI003F512EDE